MSDRRTPTRLVATVIVVGTLLRVTIAATIGMGVDESYAVVVARTPSWSYFDHPGLSFWIPGLLARAAGSENAVLLRAPFILMFAATTWVVYRLGARLFGDWAGAYAALLLNIAPVFTVAFGGWVLPDGPLDLFVAVAVLGLAHVFFAPGRNPTESRLRSRRSPSTRPSSFPSAWRCSWSRIVMPGARSPGPVRPPPCASLR